jgi:hypothetical protein
MRMSERSNGRTFRQTASSLNGELEVTTSAGMKDQRYIEEWLATIGVKTKQAV